jgi:hypothetical protein
MRLNFRFLQTDGVPLTADLMDVLQQAYAIFNVLGDIAGNLTILKGCEVNGTFVESGIVVINGDVLFLKEAAFTIMYLYIKKILKRFSKINNLKF